MTIDERLDRLTDNIESLYAAQHGTFELMVRQHADRMKEIQRVEAREARGRKALLDGIRLYLEVTSGDENQDQDAE